jgi:predicted ATPase/transcriptional regulator with XRE-family HTH domain
VSEGTASFSDLLRQLRRAASLSQEELAARVSLSVRGISDLERGARSAPRLETVRMLADALALDEDARTSLLNAARPTSIRGGAVALAPSPPVTVPAQLTRLIGRDAEITAIQAWFRGADARLVTVTGAGGTGKTRLAIEVATRVRGDYRDGVYFVDLSPLTDSALVEPTIAAVLGVRESREQRLGESLSDFLAPKQHLLLLDNCEQVLAAAPAIAAMLTASPKLSILATSREPLHVRGEHEFPLAPLPLPGKDQLPALEELARIPAIALFVERAMASQPDFTLTADNAAAVAAICRRLDGLPLAIELAAARIKVLPPAALLARLGNRLPLLTGGGGDLPARQRTMRAAIAWSYDLLSPEEQALFRGLSVFAGGFSLGAAEAVATPDAALDVLDGVIALVEQSLLRQVPGIDQEPRYLMLETVREFGLEELAAVAETGDARERHARHFLQLADSAVPGLTVPMDQASLTQVAADHDNVRLALTWFNDHNEIDALLRLSPMLYGLWFGRGLYREGLQWVERALARSGHVASATRVHALNRASTLAIFQGDYARGEAFIEEGLALAQELGDPTLVGEAKTYAAFLAYRRQAFARAEELLADARLTLGGRVDGVQGLAPFFTLGDLALAQGQFDRAARQYEREIMHFRSVGNEWGVWDMQAGLAAVSYCTGDVPRAAALYGESLRRSHELDLWPLLPSSLIGLSGVAVELGHPDVGARLLGAAEGSAASLDMPHFTRDLPVHERVLAALRSALGDERLAVAREAGRTLTIDQAVVEATAVVEAVLRVSADQRADESPSEHADPGRG